MCEMQTQLTETDGTVPDPPQVGGHVPPQHREDGVSWVVDLRGNSSCHPSKIDMMWCDNMT